VLLFTANNKLELKEQQRQVGLNHH